MKTKTKTIIGVALVALAILTYMYTTPVGAYLPSANPDGKDISCAVTFDHNGISGQVCTVSGPCRTGAFLSFLGFGSDPRTLQLVVNQRTYASATYQAGVAFGIPTASQTQTIEACVPATTQNIILNLLDDQSKIINSKTVAIQ